MPSSTPAPAWSALNPFTNFLSFSWSRLCPHIQTQYPTNLNATWKTKMKCCSNKNVKSNIHLKQMDTADISRRAKFVLHTRKSYMKPSTPTEWHLYVIESKHVAMQDAGLQVVIKGVSRNEELLIVNTWVLFAWQWWWPQKGTSSAQSSPCGPLILGWKEIHLCISSTAWYVLRGTEAANPCFGMGADWS